MKGMNRYVNYGREDGEFNNGKENKIKWRNRWIMRRWWERLVKRGGRGKEMKVKER